MVAPNGQLGSPTVLWHFICDELLVRISLGAGEVFHSWFKRDNPTGFQCWGRQLPRRDGLKTLQPLSHLSIPFIAGTGTVLGYRLFNIGLSAAEGYLPTPEGEILRILPIYTFSVHVEMFFTCK